MARIFTSAPGVVKLVLGEEWSETGLPECFQMSKARLDKLGKGLASEEGKQDRLAKSKL